MVVVGQSHTLDKIGSNCDLFAFPLAPLRIKEKIRCVEVLGSGANTIALHTSVQELTVCSMGPLQGSLRSQCYQRGFDLVQKGLV